MIEIALLGSDVSKSPSPAMQNAAFLHVKLPWNYSAVSIEENRFEAKLPALMEKFQGFNITIPFKETIIPHLDTLTATARRVRAVNTVKLEGEKWIGENTDVAGFLLAATEVSFPRAGPVFILGAGGAAKAAVEALFSLGHRRFTAASRTRERLESFATWFHATYPPEAHMQTILLSEEKLFVEILSTSTIFVNASPLAACGEISCFKALRFPEETLCIEWVYLPRITPWIEKARRFVEGYKILLFQGMKAFQFWTGAEPPREVMEKALLERIR